MGPLGTIYGHTYIQINCNRSFKFIMGSHQLTWLITGCSSGFGLSLTRAAQAGGHKVIATSRNPSRTPDLVAEIEGKGGKWVQLDVDSPQSGNVITELEKGGEQIDILVNNAGGSIYAPIETSTEEEIRAQMETMYFGPLRLIRAVLPHMRQRRSGVIVNMSSGASLDGIPTMGVYGGAKAGLDGMSDPPLSTMLFGGSSTSLRQYSSNQDPG